MEDASLTVTVCPVAVERVKPEADTSVTVPDDPPAAGVGPLAARARRGGGGRRRGGRGRRRAGRAAPGGKSDHRAHQRGGRDPSPPSVRQQSPNPCGLVVGHDGAPLLGTYQEGCAPFMRELPERGVTT